MAKQQRAEQVKEQGSQKDAESAKGGGVLAWGAGVVASRVRDGWESGHVQAFGRQGLNELGTVFGKALPDSTQVDEPGAIFNPLYRDMPSRSGPNLYGHQPDAKPPSEIAEEKTPQLQQEQEKDQGLER